MRIAQVAPLYESVPPRLYGGTERVVSWLTEKLVSFGHDVTLFASGDSVTNARLVPACKKALRLDRRMHRSACASCSDGGTGVLSQAEEFDLIHFHIDYFHFSHSRRVQVPCVTPSTEGRIFQIWSHFTRNFAEIPVVSISDAQRLPLPWVNWVGTVHHGLPPNLLSLNQGGGGYLAFLGRVSPEKGAGSRHRNRNSFWE